MSESVGHRPPEEINIPENEVIAAYDPADVFADSQQESLDLPENHSATGTALNGLRAVIAEKRADRAAKRAERTVQASNVQAARRAQAKNKPDEYEGRTEYIRPRTRSERRKDKKFVKAAHKKAVADVYAYRTDKNFGPKSVNESSDALTKSERRMAKWEIRQAYRKGELTAAEARLKQLEIDSAPLRLDMGFRNMTEKSQRKAQRKINNVIDDGISEKTLQRRYGKAVDAVIRHDERAKRLRGNTGPSTREHQLETPDYYLDSANILTLKRSIKKETEKRVAMAIADAIDSGRDESEVRDYAIRSATMQEGIARYFGFKSWDEAEARIPHRLLDGVIQKYGLSEAELEAEIAGTSQPGNRESRTERHIGPIRHEEVTQPAEAEISSESSVFEPAEEEPDVNSVDFIKELANPENRGAVYENQIKLLAGDIEDTVSRMMNDVRDPAEKRELIDQIYTFYIADFLGVPQDSLKNPDIVPKELTDQLLRDIRQARQEIAREVDEEARRVAYNVNQRVSFRYSEAVRGKDLSEQQREETKLRLFVEALADEIGVDTAELNDPYAVDQRLMKKVLDQIDKSEQERQERAAKQREADAGNEALDKLRNIIND